MPTAPERARPERGTFMIEAQRLLKDLRRLLKTLTDDIRERLGESPGLQDTLSREWQAARDAGRTGAPQIDWLRDEITQAAVHWILGCVFLRFIEDNGLVERPWLAGPGPRRELAADRHQAWFRAHPHDSDRDYLMACFREAEALPGVGALFDEAHNPLWRLPVSGDGAMALRAFFRRVNPDTGALDHDFADPDHGTRFLGDLYQDLSEDAKKRFALLQTPGFVEHFILDRTLKPAIAEFGWAEVRLIDPACGSGHFLLDAFHRLFDLRVRHEPAVPLPALAQAALDQVAGVDINPFAVAIARFRLLVVALKACGITGLRNAPDFKIHVAVGDSLLHGRRFGELGISGAALHTKTQGVRHFAHAEDEAALERILGRQYHAVVGNPPYITPKDPVLNLAYRNRYDTCHMKYALVVPFIERFFDLAVRNGENPAGFVGMIVANSFMKREFGRKLIERFFPTVDLTHVCDTAGAYIPGHGTPTVILFGRRRPPVAAEVRTVMGIKGEPTTPADPAKGLVWQAILGQIDHPGSEGAYVSVADTSRSSFARHPWSIGGGGAAELKEMIEGCSASPLEAVTAEVGITSVTGEDACYVGDCPAHFARKGVEQVRALAVGDSVRDWAVASCPSALWLYDSDIKLMPLKRVPYAAKYLWRFRSAISHRRRFGVPMLQRGLSWYEFQELYTSKLRTPLSITFAEVATHNHFVLDRGGKVFNRTAPVIKLPPGSSEDDHLALLGLLNSSTACFWLKQACHNKGSTVDQKGARQRTAAFEDFYAFNAANVNQLPLVEPHPVDLATALDGLGQELTATLPTAVLARGVPTRADLDAARGHAASLRRRMIALQEELDWRCYRLYGLTDEDLDHPAPPEIDLGQRAFEIVMARQMAAGSLETTWFERHGSTPITEIPKHWPGEYRALVERRMEAIATNRWIALIERPEYKRRWQWRGWEDREREALRDWLLDRLEEGRYWRAPVAIRSVNQLADLAREDADFMAVAALYTGRQDFIVAKLVAALVDAEAVPFLPSLRYSAEGLRKRDVWERTWNLQRREDAGEDVGDIPVPPKYRSKDFLRSDYWRLRGGLDVPKERFVSYPGCARDADGSLPVAWAGYDHRQQAEALWTYYAERKDREGWEKERLSALLAGLVQLLPWLKQWHNELDGSTGVRFGDYFAALLADEARALGCTIEELKAWKPEAAPVRRGRARKAATLDA